MIQILTCGHLLLIAPNFDCVEPIKPLIIFLQGKLAEACFGLKNFEEIIHTTKKPVKSLNSNFSQYIPKLLVWLPNLVLDRSSHRRCFVKKVFLKDS